MPNKSINTKTHDTKTYLYDAPFGLVYEITNKKCSGHVAHLVLHSKEHGSVIIKRICDGTSKQKAETYCQHHMEDELRRWIDK